jgi:signal transduction histidine kinase
LLSADPPLWTLHVLAGGDADGAVAIPALAALAALVLRTRMRVERPIRAADEDNDVELWVAAAPHDDIAELSIIGWRDIPPFEKGFAQHQSMDVANNGMAAVMIDADMRIVRLPVSVTPNGVGRHIGAVFVLLGDDRGGIPLVDALTERRSVSDEAVGIVGQASRYKLFMEPQFGADGAYVGHAGTITPVVEQEAVREPLAGNNAHLGRQFASVLKQPLSRIVANAETIGSKMHGPLRDNYAEYADDIANAARHLAELVKDMEDLEAIDRPDFSVASDRIELGDVARRVCGLLALKASDHNIQLKSPTEIEKVPAIGEFRRVLQIVLNLVGNAIRYAPNGSQVTVSIEMTDGIATINVADEGQGVPEEDRERVFDKFERLGRSGDGGSGLGLYISRRLAKAMGGDLTVSNAPGGGALFSLTLPNH